MRYSLTVVLLFCLFLSHAQSPRGSSSSDILQQMKKLQVFGSVLYIAAHPDDENTRLLSYLANEKLYRTGYLSLTRGDGGQNLIGDEQGIDLGLIRTQELLAARKVDGAEQFFTRAYDFGYSKSPEEALRIWDHDKILSDVVWVIRKFRPDVIITRFPTTGEGGHGHHTASAILAREAFDAAGDLNRFPEHFKYGVTTWTAKRLLWNAFNFGNNNTTKDDQFKLDVGSYNPVLGLSYGEMAAASRSNHRSQGFGVPAQRGSFLEYFATLKGSKPITELLDGVDVSVDRFNSRFNKAAYREMVRKIISEFNPSSPRSSLPVLQSLYRFSGQLADSVYHKAGDIAKLIANVSGFFMEAIAANHLNTIGDSARITLVFNNRSGVKVDSVQAFLFGKKYFFDSIKANVSAVQQASLLIPNDAPATQPYWLVNPMSAGSFAVSDQHLAGKAQVSPDVAMFNINMGGLVYNFEIPLQYKFTDPVKGELYQPVQFINPVFINTSPSLIIFSTNKKNEQRQIQYTLQSNVNIKDKISFKSMYNNVHKTIFDSVINMQKGEKRMFNFTLNGNDFDQNKRTNVSGVITSPSFKNQQLYSLNKISYDHIPDIFYNYADVSRIIKIDLKTEGRSAGYIAGAGDKIPEALQQMGYQVSLLNQEDINDENLKQFDVIITGVRAYNIHLWLSNAHPLLMRYVQQGGVLLSQYNTNNSIGPVRAKIAPYPFTISRNRITDENAAVNFLLPAHPALNYPNKISGKDFEGWIQERSIYHAENIDSNYQRIFSMKDPGEKEHDGSLIITDYGKGRFVYTGIVFFRELPAGVAGAYRLFANLIANKRGGSLKASAR